MTEPYQGDTQKETSLLEKLDLASPDFIQNPYNIYTKLRQDSPVTAVKTGGHLLVRHSDIVSTLKAPAFGNAPSRFSTLHEKNREKYAAADLAANILPFMDPPEHDLPRRIVTLAYRNRINQFIEELVQAAEIFASRVNTEGSCDVITQIASPFTYVTMCRFLGIPDSDGEYLKRLSEFFFYLFAPINDPDKFKEINFKLMEFREYFRACLQDRKSQPKEDMVSYLYQTDYQGEKLTEDQVVDTCILLYADGVENVHYGVGNVLIELADHPELLEQMTTSMAAANAITSEALRLNSPAQLIPRITLEETQIQGVTMTAGMPVFLALGSANRDQAEFDDPDSFIPDRDKGRVLSFGLGRHACIGGSLATMQTSSLITALANKNIKVLSKPDEVEYIPRFGHRWPRSVNIGY